MLGGKKKTRRLPARTSRAVTSHLFMRVAPGAVSLLATPSSLMELGLWGGHGRVGDLLTPSLSIPPRGFNRSRNGQDISLSVLSSD